MSNSSRFLSSLAQPVTHLADPTLLEDSSDHHPGSLIFGSASADEETICLQDLLNSPEFIEEQKLILLELEMAQVRIVEQTPQTPPCEKQEVNRRHSCSIGLRLTCPICLESLASVRSSYVKMVTQCGHVFCEDCITNVCEVSKKSYKEKDDDFGVKTLCPVCREEIGELRKVYF